DDWPTAEVGPRRRVANYREEQPGDRFLARPLERQCRVAAVVGVEASDRGQRVAGGCRGLALRPRLLDDADRVGVEAEPGREGEPAVVDLAQPQPPAASLAQGVQQRAGRLDGV